MVTVAQARQSEKRVVSVGAACVDIKGQALGPLVPGTSNPGLIRIGIGGVARNIAEALGRLGVSVSFVSAVGDDDWGRDILRRTANGGVDIEPVMVCPGERSAAYLTVVGEDGERLASIDDTDIMRYVDGRYLFNRRRVFVDASMVVADGNLSDAAFLSLFRLADRYAWIPPLRYWRSACASTSLASTWSRRTWPRQRCSRESASSPTWTRSGRRRPSWAAGWPWP